MVRTAIAPTIATLLMAATALSGCATMAPSYERPALAAPQTWPDPSQGTAASAADLAWREVFLDPKLQGVIELALAQNRDLRVAVANIESARAQYRIRRADLLPGVNAVGTLNDSHTPASVSSTGQAFDSKQYSASLGLTAFELDIFGRIRSLTQAALESFLSTAETQRAVRLSLIAETASTYLQLAADQQQREIIAAALDTRNESLRLTRSRFDAGASSALDLSQAQTLAEQARSDLAEITAAVEQDRNALRLVVGVEVPADLLPAADIQATPILAELPAGMPSDVLTQRPDVLAAEHRLRARNADIGAARAAFFPRISLTGSTGATSSEFGNLFKNGTGAWSFAPQVVLPIFSGGANVAGLKGAKAERDAALAQYERAVQVAFREVADALAVRATIRERVAAQERLVQAASQAQRLSQARYDSGIDSYLVLLDAQRTLYLAQQTLLAARLTESVNRVVLYKSLGGGVS